MELALKEVFILNGRYVDTDEFNIRLSKNNAYEVIRVIDKTPLFLKDHLKRLEFSIAKLENDHFLSKEKLVNNIIKLIKKNKLINGNIKILYNFKDFYYYIIPHDYPDKNLYEKGINTATLDLSRERPNIKNQNSSYKEAVTSFIRKTNIYEALLIDENGFIKEGSKSNVFFLKDNVFYTSPRKDVLPGITRNKVIELLLEKDFILKEESININDFPKINGAFITGTSPKILPIRKINNYYINSGENKNIITLLKDYNFLVEKYIKENKEAYRK